MPQRVAALLLLFAAFFSALPARAQPGTPQDAVTLLPGDIIRVEIWRETDLSGEFTVNENGTVILPLLGEQPVRGIPMAELRTRLMDLYQKQLRNPSITITPLRRVNILGYVQRPGVYPIDPTTTLAGAVTLAGGATPEGDLRRIRIIRGGEVIRERVGEAETISNADVRSNDQVVVGRRSWFERNTNFIVTTTLAVTSIVISILRN